jgi:hypothetical protein
LQYLCSANCDDDHPACQRNGFSDDADKMRRVLLG